MKTLIFYDFYNMPVMVFVNNLLYCKPLKKYGEIKGTILVFKNGESLEVKDKFDEIREKL